MPHEGLILLIKNYCKKKVVKPSPSVEKKHKLLGNDPYATKIKVKNEEGVSNSKAAEKGNKREIKKKNVEEVIESDKIVEDEDKIEMGDLSSNLDGYSRSRGISDGKDNVDNSKERKTESNNGSKASRHDKGNQSAHPTSTKGFH